MVIGDFNRLDLLNDLLDISSIFIFTCFCFIVQYFLPSLTWLDLPDMLFQIYDLGQHWSIKHETSN